MKLLNNLFVIVVISCLNLFVSALPYKGYKPSEGSTYLDFPPFAGDFTGKNGFYVLYYEDKNRFPTLLPTRGCRVNIKDKTVYCRIEDSAEEEIVKKNFGGCAQVLIDHVKFSNPNKCDTFEKLLSEVVLYNADDIEYQIIGSTLGEVFAEKFSFELNDGCIFYGEFDHFKLEAL